MRAVAIIVILCLPGTQAVCTITVSETIVTCAYPNPALSTVPPEISILTTKLNLQGNAITSGGLNHLDYLSELIELNLEDNDILSTSVLSVGSGLSSLTDLTLSFNKLQVIPDMIGIASTLRRLNLANNLMTEILAGSLGYLTELLLVDVSYNALTTIPNGIFVYGPSGCEKLLSANFEHNAITSVGDVVFTFGVDKSLSELNLGHNQLSAVPEAVKARPSLIKLSFDSNRITIIGSSDLEGLSLLSDLDLSSNEIISIADGALTLPKLHRLEGSGNPLICSWSEVSPSNPLNISSCSCEEFFIFTSGHSSTGSGHCFPITPITTSTNTIITSNSKTTTSEVSCPSAVADVAALTELCKSVTSDVASTGFYSCAHACNPGISCNENTIVSVCSTECSSYEPCSALQLPYTTTKPQEESTTVSGDIVAMAVVLALLSVVLIVLLYRNKKKTVDEIVSTDGDRDPFGEGMVMRGGHFYPTAEPSEVFVAPAPVTPSTPEPERPIWDTDPEAANKAAAKIQGGFRGQKARKEARKQNIAATKIQAGFRGAKTRKELKEARKPKMSIYDKRALKNSQNINPTSEADIGKRVKVRGYPSEGIIRFYGLDAREGRGFRVGVALDDRKFSIPGSRVVYLLIFSFIDFLRVRVSSS